MPTAGSVRSGEASSYTPPSPGSGSAAGAGKPRRTRIFRWQGIIPIALVGALVLAGWSLFADRIMRGAVIEAGSKALGAQLDIDGFELRIFSTTLEMRGVALANPFDSTRNLFEVGRLVVQLEPRPLLEKKFVVKQVQVGDVRTGTTRSVPARPVSGGGFAPRALTEVKRFAAQFTVPLLSLTPIDTLKSLILDPAQLQSVQAALALAQRADSAKDNLERGYNGLRLQETLDSSTALLTRLQGTDIRSLGIAGARTAAADLRRAIARVDSARGRVDGLVGDARRSGDQLQAGVRSIDDARRADYEFARGLLKLPSVNAPDIGTALFGQVTIDRFEQAVYWASLAREYAPPGLLPKETPGPTRVRSPGTTVHFVTPQAYPRFLVRRVDINASAGGAANASEYRLAAADITTEPALIGRPTLFAVRRNATGGAVDSIRIVGSIDHLGARPRETVTAFAGGVALPRLAVPGLPLAMDPGRGSSQLRFAFEGNRLTGRWTVRSSNLSWVTDSTSRRLNTVEGLVARVLTGIRELDLTADIGGTLQAPTLSVRSNLDRQVADRLRAVVGEEVAAAQQKVRAQVDRIVEERSAPVKARVEELRAESDRRIADARARLDAEKKKLEDRLKAFAATSILGGALD
jgi:uncharacterized protein (TIGR03545 family)